MKLLKIKIIVVGIGILANLLAIFFGIVVFVSLFSAVATSHAKRGHDCGPTKSKVTESTVAISPADQTVDSFIKEHEEAYVLSWKAGGYLPSFSIAQTFVEYGFNFTNPSGTSFWMAHNMGGVKTGGNISNFQPMVKIQLIYLEHAQVQMLETLQVETMRGLSHMTQGL